MMGKRNIRLILEYDGTGYHGWQRQKNENTIQAVMEDRIRMMVNEPVTLTASGRTDAGVHALYQVCNLITESGIEPEPMRRGLNSLLPDDIFVRKTECVPLDFHSRYSARSKVYEYRIMNQEDPDLFLRNYTWHIRRKLTVEDMRKCLAMLTGRHDFSSFRSTGSSNRDPVREMMRAELNGPVDNILFFVFEANGFLRHMVRNIVGSVVEVGQGRTSVSEFEEILRSGDRCRAGIKAPSRGLFLKLVKY